MDSLSLLETFCEVAQRGSFAATARSRGVSPASVSRAVAELEARFKLRLLNRTTRKVSLTDAGQLLLERSGALLELVDSTQDDLLDRATHPSGRLAITAPHSLVQTELALLLGRFMQQYPRVVIDMHVTDRVVSLAEEGIDLAFRMGPVPDANLIVRRLMPIRYVAAASPAYWRARGKPSRPADLRAHAQLAYHLPDQAPRWLFSVDGKPFELPLQPLFSSTDHAPLMALALAGLGVVWGARHAVAEPIRRGELEPALQDYSPAELWLYAAYQQRLHNSAALRALIDHLGGFAHAFEQPKAGALGVAS